MVEHIRIRTDKSRAGHVFDEARVYIGGIWFYAVIHSDIQFRQLQRIAADNGIEIDDYRKQHTAA